MSSIIKKPNQSKSISAILVSCLLITGCAVRLPGFFSASGGNSEQSYSAPVDLDEVSADLISDNDIINREKSHVRRSGEIYLMRGLANTFSRGIDDLTAKMRRQGYDAVNFSYTQWPAVATDITLRQQSEEISFPIIIIGHSLGGNESSKFANYLGERGIPVEYVVTLDPVETGVVGQGVKNVVNYYLPKSADNRLLAGKGFNGKIENIDVSHDAKVSHTNIDKNKAFHAFILKHVGKITQKIKPEAHGIASR